MMPVKDTMCALKVHVRPHFVCGEHVGADAERRR
jgi:hypothetical protein